MIRHSSDLRMLLFLLVVTAMKMMPFLIERYTSLALLGLLSFGTFIIHTIRHNHIHLSIFKSRGWNQGLDFLFTVLTGVQNSDMRIVHLINHHVHIDGEKDWGNTKISYSKREWLNFIMYTVFTLRSFILNKQAFLKQNPKERKKHRVEFIFLLMVYSGLLVWKPYITMVYLFLPNLIGQLLLIAFNYFQHIHCDEESQYNHSRNFTGKFINWLTFNNGYHTAHHHRPHLHWSLYPAYHQAISEHIINELKQNNVMVYLFNLLVRNKKLN